MDRIDQSVDEACRGLLALQRGAVESESLGRALFSFSIGLGTAFLCIAAVSLMRVRAQKLRAELGRIARLLDSTIGSRDDM